MSMFLSDPVPFIIVCCLFVALAALVGGWLPLLIRMTHTRIQIAISFVAGMMLGIALLHFIPAAAEQLHSLDRTMSWALVGFLMMFFLGDSRRHLAMTASLRPLLNQDSSRSSVRFVKIL